MKMITISLAFFILLGSLVLSGPAAASSPEKDRSWMASIFGWTTEEEKPSYYKGDGQFHVDGIKAKEANDDKEKISFEVSHF